MIETPGLLQLSALVASHPNETGPLVKTGGWTGERTALRKAGMRMRVGVVDSELDLQRADDSWTEKRHDESDESAALVASAHAH